jgi:hypothetical protein
MSKEQEFNIEEMEEMLEDLSYSMASPPAIEMMQHIRLKEFKEAEKILIDERVSENNAKKLVAYLHNKISQRVELVEISLNEIELKKSKDKYLFRIGEKLIKSSLYEREPGKFSIFTEDDVVPIEKAEQVWKVVKKKPEN